MENNMNSRLKFENYSGYSQDMIIGSDRWNETDLIYLTFLSKGNEINLRNDEHEYIEGQEMFHLDKFQVKCLIDYLKNIYDVMK
jgi:hypothetical protein